MNVQNIIKDALVEYDTAQPVIKYLLKNTYTTGKRAKNDFKRSVLKFYNKDTKELVLETEVELLAFFYDKLNIWSWAWAQPGLYNADYYLSKEILIYALSLQSELAYLKSILSTSRGVIKDWTQIDINLALSSSIVKQPYIFPFAQKLNEYNIYNYYILLNKEKLDVIRDSLGKINSDQVDIEFELEAEKNKK
jgi:hypothetical protein